MPTRQHQADFEESLMCALNRKEIVDSISSIIIKAVESHFTAKFNEIENRISSLEKEICILKTNNNSITTDVSPESQKQMEKKLDDIQQKNKNNNIRFIRVPEAENEDVKDKIIKIIRNKMKIDIDESSMVAFRVGQKKENQKPRHIKVCFNDSALKMNVYRKKTSLKGTKYIIKEDLTVLRLNAIKEASTKYGFKNVWSMNGNIFAKTEQGVKKISIY